MSKISSVLSSSVKLTTTHSKYDLIYEPKVYFTLVSHIFINKNGIRLRNLENKIKVFSHGILTHPKILLLLKPKLSIKYYAYVPLVIGDRLYILKCLVLPEFKQNIIILGNHFMYAYGKGVNTEQKTILLKPENSVKYELE